MSSILDALSKVDRAEPTGTPPVMLPAPLPPRRPTRLVAGIVLAAVVAFVGRAWWTARDQRGGDPTSEATATRTGSGGAANPHGEHAGPSDDAAGRRGEPAAANDTAVAPAAPSTPTSAVTDGAAPPPRTASAALPVTAPIPPPSVGPLGERPWVRMEDPAPANVEALRNVQPQPDLPPEPAAAPVAVAPAAAVPPRPRAPEPRAVIPDAVITPRLPPEPDVPKSPAAAEASAVRVSFLAYSRNPELRTVTLDLGGGQFVTLREGSQEGDLAVTRIYGDRVDLVRNGVRFTVRARN